MCMTKVTFFFIKETNKFTRKGRFLFSKMFHADELLDAFFDDELFALNKICLSVLGLWPFQNTRRRRISMFVMWIGVFTAVVPQVSIIIYHLRF